MKHETQSGAILLNPNTLPAHMERECRIELGNRFVAFGKRVPGDPYFREVIFPSGWKKVMTTHPMWAKVLDEKGHEVVALFYKPLHYDRKALTRLPHPSLPN